MHTLSIAEKNNIKSQIHSHIVPDLQNGLCQQSIESATAIFFRKNATKYDMHNYRLRF